MIKKKDKETLCPTWHALKKKSLFYCIAAKVIKEHRQTPWPFTLLHTEQRAMFICNDSRLGSARILALCTQEALMVLLGKAGGARLSLITRSESQLQRLAYFGRQVA